MAQASQADKTASEAVVKEEHDSLAAVQSEYEAALKEAEVKSALVEAEAQNLVEKSLAGTERPVPMLRKPCSLPRLMPRARRR